MQIKRSLNTFGITTRETSRYEEITKGSPYRARGKVASLACQYGGAEGALISMGALNFVEEDELKGLVQSWRTANPHIVNYWYEIDGAVKAAVKERKMTTVGRVALSG